MQTGDGNNSNNNKQSQLTTTLTKKHLGGAVNNTRAKSTIKGAQMNNYLQEHQLINHVLGNQQTNMRGMVNQSPLYNQLHIAQRLKSKRSESVVTQRPPEISASKAGLVNGGMQVQQHSRGRNTTLITGAGPDSVLANSNKNTNKFKQYGGRPLQYVMPQNKKQSTLTFEQASQGSGYESMQSGKGQQQAFNNKNTLEQ